MAAVGLGTGKTSTFLEKLKGLLVVKNLISYTNVFENNLRKPTTNSKSKLPIVIFL